MMLGEGSDKIGGCLKELGIEVSDLTSNPPRAEELTPSRNLSKRS